MAKQAIKYVVLGGVLVLGQSVCSSELVYRFNSPSFNGINQSAHYLTHALTIWPVKFKRSSMRQNERQTTPYYPSLFETWNRVFTRP